MVSSLVGIGSIEHIGRGGGIVDQLGSDRAQERDGRETGEKSEFQT